MKKGARIFLNVVLGFVLLFALYFIAAGLSLFLPRNADFRQDENGISIYVLSNGVHTDIVVPVRNAVTDWSREIPRSDFRTADTTQAAIAFGWGDKGFYLHTPTWADLKVSTALYAMSGLDSSVMHVRWERYFPAESEDCRRIKISPAQYAQLCSVIRSSFAGTTAQRYVKAGNGYGASDVFYEAGGCYSAFCTCNTWTGSTLRSAGIRMASWTPFVKSVFYQLPSPTKP